MICPNCGSELTKVRKGWFCEDCGYKLPIGQVFELPADDLFYSDAFYSYYPLLAHEYHVLYGFMKERNFFGALLEYKDVVEIVLKFPTLAAINHLWRKDDYELPEEKSIIELLLGKPLSLGDWKAICELFIKLYGRKGLEDYGLAAALKPLLEAVNKFYSQGRIVNWRNETIGHGALQTNLESDAEFIGEFSDRLKALKSHLEDNRVLYERFEVLDASSRPLRGKDCEEQISDTPKIKLGGAEYSQEPFILIKDRTTNIFDSCVKDSVYVLNYITGSKEPHGLPVIFTEKRKVYFSNERLAELGQSASKITDTAFNSGEMEILSKMADEKEAFTSPEYIIDDIKNFLAKFDSGVLFLQMERGMGKTTLVRALDQLAMGNVRLDDGQNDMIVRAYYINNMFSYRIDHFQNESCVILANARNFGIERITLSGIATNFINAEDMSAEFARFLNDMLCVYQDKALAGKLLYIIDGLDEIRHDEREKRTIFGCIPHSEKLSEGVYVILTGRHKNEVATWINEKYAAIEDKAVSTARYSRSDEHNTRTLEVYLAKQRYAKETAKLNAEEAEDIKKVIEKGDHRFLYVRALRELLKVDNFDINEISGGNIMERYLKVLERKYGKGKHYDKMKRLLLITALLDEPATIEELSYLYSFEPADLKFIGCLTDLKGLLHFDRTGIGETISVGAMHDDWKRYLVEGNKEMVQSIIAGWINETNEKVRSYINEDTTVLDNITGGESYLVANIYALTEAYHPELKDFFSNEDVRGFMSDFAEEIATDNTTISATRAEKIYSGIISGIEAQTEPSDEAGLACYFFARGLQRSQIQLLDGALSDFGRCIDIREELRNEGKLPDGNDLAFVYLTRGDVYHLMTEYCKAIADFDRSVELLEELRGGEFFDGSNLATAYNDRGLAYWSMTEYAKAIAEYDLGIEIMERLREEGEYFDEDLLATAYMNRGSVYNSMTEYGKAIAEYDKCIEIWGRLRDERELFNETYFAMAYMNRGMVYYSITEYGKAIAEYDRCIEIWERLRDGGKLFDENNLALVYMNRGLACYSISDYVKALADYGRCVEIYERMRDEGKLFDENNLAKVYMNRGLACYSISDYAKALADYGICVDMWERLYDEGRLYDESYLAKAYMNRGMTYDSITEYDKAIAEYDKVVEIFEWLYDEGKLFDENSFALAYMNRGMAYYSMTERDKAMASLDNCVVIMERLRDDGRLFNEDNLAVAYMDRGLVYSSMMEKYREAIADYDKCIEILERWRNDGRLFDENILARAYINRGDTFESMTEYKMAIADYDRGVEIRERLRNAGKLFNENELAIAYLVRGHALESMRKYNKATSDYDRGIEILERLKNVGEFYDEDLLAEAYKCKKAAMHVMKRKKR